MPKIKPLVLDLLAPAEQHALPDVRQRFEVLFLGRKNGVPFSHAGQFYQAIHQAQDVVFVFFEGSDVDVMHFHESINAIEHQKEMLIGFLVDEAVNPIIVFGDDVTRSLEKK